MTMSADVITSKRGSVRGVEGGVDKVLDSIKERSVNVPLTLKRIQEEEIPNEEVGKGGKIVVYITSIQAVRETYEHCKQVVQVLRGYKVQVTLKDVFLHPDYGKELCERLECDTVQLPQVFINGKHIGDGPTTIGLNEAGQLRTMLEGFEKSTCEEVCGVCGGQRFILCLWCQGSKRGIRNTFNDLKCTVCNENALQKCPSCSM